MALTVGDRLGHYNVTARIGEGGMGQVYQATDTKLNRQVALKILPEAFAADPDRLARFQREAQVLASLNHPNIAAIHGLEDSEGTKALVLELVEGPTLADRIAQGPIPIDEALPIAKQIAEALEAAHEAGVIHRDLKPANIKVKDDGTVKVLDFGLAKALDPSPDADPSQSPTLTAAATQMGVILGTAAYMSPEQAAGQPTDKRGDIWSFGVVLFEMLTAQRLFTGKTVSHVLAKVLDRDVDFAALPTPTPEPCRRLLRRCLEREPKRRLRDVGEAVIHLEEATTASSRDLVAPSGPTVAQLQVWQRPIPAAIGVLVLVVVSALLAWSLVRPAPAPVGTVTRLSFILPEGDVMGITDGMAISPDGRLLVYAGERDGTQQLFVRPRDQMTVRPLGGTEGARHPFFSPEGAWVGFFADGSLKKVALAGGPPVTLCATGAILGGATWGPDDTIVFASVDALGLMQVSDAGGEPRSLTEPPEGTRHRWPTFVPGGGAVLYTNVVLGNFDAFEVAVVRLDTDAQQTLVDGTYGTVTASGHLVFGREASLWAVPFDPDQLTVSGEPAPMVEGVQVNTGGWAQYALADDGTLVYLPTAGDDGDQAELVWVDRVTGDETPLGAPPRAYRSSRISPDGTRVAVEIRDQQDDIWVWDLTGGTLTRLTLDAGQDSGGVWTPDSQRLIFGSTRAGLPALFWKAADGTGTTDPLGDGERPRLPMAVAPDGSVVVAMELNEGSLNLITVSLTGDPVSEDLLVTEFNEGNAALSPNGQWVAYQSNTSGEFEVYVRPFPDADSALHPISTNGGRNPLWAPDGRELFYVESDGRLLAVPIQTDPTFARGTATVVMDGDYQPTAYDIDPSGERFLVVKPMEALVGDSRSLPSLTFVLNWVRELTERVPVN